MAASQSSFGMRHPTVVPTNFEPTTEGEENDSEEAVDAGAIAADAVDTATDAVDSE